jgi:hypothetical protein
VETAAHGRLWVRLRSCSWLCQPGKSQVGHDVSTVVAPMFVTVKRRFHGRCANAIHRRELCVPQSRPGWVIRRLQSRARRRRSSWRCLSRQHLESTAPEPCECFKTTTSRGFSLLTCCSQWASSGRNGSRPRRRMPGPARARARSGICGVADVGGRGGGCPRHTQFLFTCCSQDARHAR